MSNALNFLTAPFNNMRTVEFKKHHAKCVLLCCQSCHAADISANKCTISQGSKVCVPDLVTGRFQSMLIVSALNIRYDDE